MLVSLDDVYCINAACMLGWFDYFAHLELVLTHFPSISLFLSTPLPR